MYGKHFSSMYTGSMVGAGAVVFAVMGYVISNGKPDRVVGMQVELNPKLLAFIFGEPEQKVVEAIEYLCSPDKDSRSGDEEGRRLVKLSQYAYRVVNGPKYRAIRDEERRRQTDRESKQRQRARKGNLNGKPLPGEMAYVKAVEEGDDEMAERMLRTAGERAERRLEEAAEQMARELAEDPPSLE